MFKNDSGFRNYSGSVSIGTSGPHSITTNSVDLPFRNSGFKEIITVPYDLPVNSIVQYQFNGEIFTKEEILKALIEVYPDRII